MFSLEKSRLKGDIIAILKVVFRIVCIYTDPSWCEGIVAHFAFLWTLSIPKLTLLTEDSPAAKPWHVNLIHCVRQQLRQKTERRPWAQMMRLMCGKSNLIACKDIEKVCFIGNCTKALMQGG